jgi:hypothetical protein
MRELLEEHYRLVRELLDRFLRKALAWAGWKPRAIARSSARCRRTTVSNRKTRRMSDTTITLTSP